MLVGATLALTATSALSACSLGTDADEGLPQPSPDGPPISRAIAIGPDLRIGGERLDTTLLQRFYARHDYEPVWASRQPQAELLTQAVLHASDQGLDPELFHAALLRQASKLSDVDRDLVLSDAFLTYADALARGAVPVERRGDDQVLAPEPVDVTAVLHDAMDSSDPARAIEDLAPQTPTYRALLDALRRVHASKVHDAAHLRTIEVNLERQRWLPRPLPADRVWVNAADQALILYRNGQPVFSTRVVVGEDIHANQSPEFHTTLDATFTSPPWVIPASITQKEVLPQARRDPNYLRRNHMILLANGEAEQLPGPDAGLGLIMFDMPNHFDVFLHDTPDRSIFNRADRRLSHGCIRVQNPRQLAALLSDQPVSVIDSQIATGQTTRHDLPTPVPVFVVYQTAFLDPAGQLVYRPDFYHRDAAIWQALHRVHEETSHTRPIRRHSSAAATTSRRVK